MAEEFLSKLTASCFPLSSTLSELALLCVTQECKEIMGHRCRSVNQVISCQLDIPSGKKQTTFFSICLGKSFLNCSQRHISKSRWR